jgi:hypothetical protein
MRRLRPVRPDDGPPSEVDLIRRRLVADLAYRQITNGRLARTDTLITVGGEPNM